MPHTRRRKRTAPSMPLSDQRSSFSAGAANNTNMRVAADVLIDGSPLRGDRWIEWRSLVTWIGIAKEVPGRIHKGVHRVRFASGRPPTLRTHGVHEFGHGLQRRLTCPGELGFVGQHYRQVFLRHRHRAALFAVNNRNGRAPETLARDAPIPDPVSHRTAAKFL